MLKKLLLGNIYLTALLNSNPPAVFKERGRREPSSLTQHKVKRIKSFCKDSL